MTEELYELALKAGQALKAREHWLATAESCTGGGLAYWITEIPGSSHWFDRGFVTYSNAAKEEMLGVHPSTLAEWGAVSEAVAVQMAEGALARSHATHSIAITGIAGPNSDTLKKPIGTVWITWAMRNHVVRTQLFSFNGDRHAIRIQTVRAALQGLLMGFK